MQSNNQYDAQLKVATLVWFALMGSSLVYGYVLFMAKKFNFLEVEIDSIVLSISSVAFIMPIAGLMISKKLIENAKQSQDLFAAQIIGWALAESAVVMGLVLGFMKGTAIFYISFLAYALFFFFKQRPTREQLMKFEYRS